MHCEKNGRRKARSLIENLESRRLLADLVGVYDSVTNNSRSPTLGTISFYDVTEIRGTPADEPFGAKPLFSIWTGFEVTDTAGTSSDKDYEDVNAWTVNASGTTAYVLAFDSGTPGGSTPFMDTTGDYDIYKFDIEAAYNDFITNGRARGVLYAPRYSPDFDPNDLENTSGIDYIARYGGTLGPTGLPAANSANVGIPALRPQAEPDPLLITLIRDNTDTDPSNDIVFLDGVSVKIGEVGRVQQTGSVFFDQQDIQWVNDTTLLLMENATKPVSGTAPVGTGILSDDYSIRTIELVDTQPGQAVARESFTAGNNAANTAGGFNAGTSQSWESFAWTGDNFVNMDNIPTDGVTAGPLSDVDGMRYLERDGVKGVWVSDRDSGGDDFSFFALDFDTRVATKLEQRVGINLPYPKAFALDEDPELNPNTNDGDLDGFDLDVNGNLVIRESDFSTAAESKFITREIENYNAGDSETPPNGINEITFGAWDTKARMVTAVDDDAGPLDTRFSVYHAGQNIMYIFDIDTGTGGSNPDVYAYDMATEQIIYSRLDITNHFFSDGNRIRAFTLGGGDTVAPTVALTYNWQTEVSVTLAFSENVSASLTAADLVLHNNTTSTTIPTGDLTLTHVSGDTYKLTYKSGAAVNPLPNGRYTLTITPAGVTDAAGNPLAGANSINFAFVQGDTDNNGAVNFDDLLTLAQNYGATSGRDASTGNVNYSADGAVNFDDLLLLAQNYNVTLPALVVKPAAGKVAAAAPAAKRKPAIETIIV